METNLLLAILEQVTVRAKQAPTHLLKKKASAMATVLKMQSLLTRFLAAQALVSKPRKCASALKS